MTLALYRKSKARQGWLIGIAVAMVVLAALAGGGTLLGGGESAQAAVGGPVCNVPGDYSTIQLAVDAAACTTVNVAAGTYVENITIARSLTLTGAGNSTKIIPAISAADPCPGTGSSLCGGMASNIILVQADNVTIANVLLDGDNPALTSGIVRGGADVDARNGIITNNNLGAYNNLTVHDVTVKNIYLRGIYDWLGMGFNFHDNNVTNVQGDYYSIAMFVWGGPGVIANNNVSWANDAISANHSAGIQFLNNRITHSQSGVHTDNAGDGGGTADLIQGNRVDCQPGSSWGIWVFVPYIAPMVRNNTVSNCQVGLGAFGGAFLPSSTVTTNFTGNRVDGKGLAGSVGVLVQTGTFGYGNTNTSAAFDHNTITNNAIGIQIDESVDIYQSPIPSSTTAVATAVFHNNAITHNTTLGLTTTTASVNATCNWWGSKTGPSGAGSGTGDGVSSNVTFLPWLKSANLNGQCTGGLDDHNGHDDN